MSIIYYCWYTSTSQHHLTTTTARILSTGYSKRYSVCSEGQNATRRAEKPSWSVPSLSDRIACVYDGSDNRIETIDRTQITPMCTQRGMSALITYRVLHSNPNDIR